MADLLKPKKKTLKRFTYRGVEIEKLLDMNMKEFSRLATARIRRRIKRGGLRKRRQARLLERLRKAKKLVTEADPKPPIVKTHLRNMVIIPEMIGSICGVYNGKTFNQVEIKPEMVGMYLGEFSITYKPVNHQKKGLGSTKARFIPMK
ncbi:small ribosomal subunit protein uS19-like [Zophobas morio]|uniref:small ribosomal subunit protein uS19-like n=1 Tax=Zophobas morio TaxID=2755281 RepID=UPI0030839B23